ncbi:hypothetical protein FMM68_03225 [Lachnospiraceae bacterium MD329]|nr:hypothetical protein [Lachnospiraceae bacterium MD329]
MRFLNEILEGALTVVLDEKKEELFNNIKINISGEDLSKLALDKTVFMFAEIVNILSEDTDDFTAIDKIVEFLRINDINCGNRHS